MSCGSLTEKGPPPGWHRPTDTIEQVWQKNPDYLRWLAHIGSEDIAAFIAEKEATQ